MGVGGGRGGGEGGEGYEGAKLETIKRIQLRHELQGSLGMSKPMKMTIHQRRSAAAAPGKLSEACARTTYHRNRE